MFGLNLSQFPPNGPCDGSAVCLGNLQPRMRSWAVMTPPLCFTEGRNCGGNVEVGALFPSNWCMELKPKASVLIPSGQIILFQPWIRVRIRVTTFSDLHTGSLEFIRHEHRMFGHVYSWYPTGGPDTNRCESFQVTSSHLDYCRKKSLTSWTQGATSHHDVEGEENQEQCGNYRWGHVEEHEDGPRHHKDLHTTERECCGMKRKVNTKHPCTPDIFHL